MNKKRQNESPEEKVAILKRRMVKTVPISDLSDELGLHPAVFSRWQTQFFKNGARAFTGSQDARSAMDGFHRIGGLRSGMRRKPFTRGI